MRLVVEWVSGDGCTFSCTNTVPVEYESAEAFLVDFEIIIKNHATRDSDIKFEEFVLGGTRFDSGDFAEMVHGKRPIEYFISLPDVMTLDEWYNREVMRAG